MAVTDVQNVNHDAAHYDNLLHGVWDCSSQDVREMGIIFSLFHAVHIVGQAAAGVPIVCLSFLFRVSLPVSDSA